MSRFQAYQRRLLIEAKTESDGIVLNRTPGILERLECVRDSSFLTSNFTTYPAPSIDAPQWDLWFMLNAIEGTQTIFCSDFPNVGNYVGWIEVRSNGEMHYISSRFNTGITGLLATGIVAGQMYHLIQQGAKIYLNGQLVHTIPGTSSQIAFGYIQLGVRRWNGNTPNGGLTNLDPGSTYGFYSKMTVFEFCSYALSSAARISDNERKLLYNRGNGCNLRMIKLRQKRRYHIRFNQSLFTSGAFTPYVGTSNMQLIQTGGTQTNLFRKRTGAIVI